MAPSPGADRGAVLAPVRVLVRPRLLGSRFAWSVSTAVQPESIADLGIEPGTELLAVNGRAARRLPRLGVPDGRRGVRSCEARLPDGERGRVRHRARAGRRRWASSSSRPTSGAARTGASSASSRGSPRDCASRSTSATTTTGSRSPTATSPRSRNLKERDIAAHPRVPALAALRLGARHAVGGAQGAAEQPARAQHRGAAHPAGRGRHPVPRPDGDRARAQRRRRARGVASRPLGPWRRLLSVAIVPVGLTQFSHLYTGESMDAGERRRAARHVERWAQRGLRERGEPLGVRLGRAVPAGGTRAAGRRALRRVPADRERRGRRDARCASACATGLDALPRLDGKRIGVVTGSAMAPLMPELLDQLDRATGATFELIPTENSLFGPTTTTAGLLVGADIRRALDGRTDLDLALIPAECINDDGLFLDDEPFVIGARERSRCRCIPRTTSSTCSSPKARMAAAARRAARRMSMPVVALVGRPNVGKSALFNRIVGGTQRHRERGAGHHARPPLRASPTGPGAHFWLVDTGGLTDDPTIPMDVEIRRQVMQAIDEADLLMLVVDAKAGLHPSDRRVARPAARRRASRGSWWSTRWTTPQDTDWYEFYELGAGDPVPVSARNGTSTGRPARRRGRAHPRGAARRCPMRCASP